MPFPVVFRFIHKTLKENNSRKVFFEFTGGEITTYSDLPMMLKFIKDHGGYTGIISNGSKSLEWWQLNSSLIDHACLSFHAERGKQDHFFNVITTLNKRSSLHINIMMLPDKFDELFAFAHKIAEEVEGVSVAIQPLFQNFIGKRFPYTEEQSEKLKDPQFNYGKNILYPCETEKKKSVFRGEMRRVFSDGSSEIVDPTLLISRQENSWKDWKCYAGVENLVITPTGQILKAVCGVDGVIGHIQDPHFKFLEDPTICPKTSCGCAFDIMCTKVKD